MRRLAAKERARLRRVGDVLAHAVEVVVGAAEVARRVVIGAAERGLEALHGAVIERRSPGDELGAGGEDRQARPARRRGARAGDVLRGDAAPADVEGTTGPPPRGDGRGAE